MRSLVLSYPMCKLEPHNHGDFVVPRMQIYAGGHSVSRPLGFGPVMPGIGSSQNGIGSVIDNEGGFGIFEEVYDLRARVEGRESDVRLIFGSDEGT